MPSCRTRKYFYPKPASYLDLLVGIIDFVNRVLRIAPCLGKEIRTFRRFKNVVQIVFAVFACIWSDYACIVFSFFDLLRDGCVIGIDTLFVVFGKLIADHLSEPRKHDEKYDKRDYRGQAHAERGIFFLFIKSHLLLLQALLVVSVSLLQYFELRTHTFHCLAVFLAITFARCQTGKV